MDPACVPPQHQCKAFEGDADQANKCCSDESANNVPSGKVDCLDSDCRDNAEVCAPWLRIEGGNVYSEGGIGGTQAPKQANVSNATYCLRSDSTIDWTSDMNCKNSNLDVGLQLPDTENKYRNRLGFLDITGIENGRYGSVVYISDVGQILNPMEGKVFIYNDTADLHIPARVLDNGSGKISGAGLLLIKNADLYIDGNLTYTTDAIQDRIKNLSSLGVIVLNGDVFINSNVDVVSGTFFVAGTIHTGTKGAGNIDNRLSLKGIFVSQTFDLQRNNNQDPTQPAEKVTFDGRAVVNPPPGMQDISKSLPRPLDTKF